MNTMDTYVDVLLASLKKKEQVLIKLDRTVEKEEKTLKNADAGVDELNELQQQKEDLLAEMEQLEIGFEKVYERAGEELSKERQKYRSQIEQMQCHIKSITDLTVKIKAQSERNRLYMEAFLQNKKREIRQYNIGNQKMAQYNRNSVNSLTGQSYFLNRKN